MTNYPKGMTFECGDCHQVVPHVDHWRTEKQGKKVEMTPICPDCAPKEDPNAPSHA